jgi:hypothetical protein
MDTTSFPPGRTDPSDQVSTKPGALHCSPVAGLRPVCSFGGGVDAHGQLDEPTETDLLSIAELLEDDVVERIERLPRVGLAHLGAVRDRGDHLRLGQRRGCSSSTVL